jgi:DNA repair protein RadD
MIKLRDYQQQAVDQVRQAIAQGHRKPLAVMATGAGKSYVMAEITRLALEKGSKVLILVHRRHLVRQLMDTMDSYVLSYGVIMAGFDSHPGRSVQIGTVQTYCRRVKIDESGPQPFFIDADLIMVDEAHRALSPTYQQVLGLYPDKVVVGFTATPCLSSGVGMGEYFDALVQPIGIDELQGQGHLVPSRPFAPSKPDLARVKTRMGDFEKKGLAKAMNTPQLVGDVVENWGRIAGGLQTIVFAVNVKHSKALRDEFLRNGIAAEHLDAHSDDEKREKILGKLYSKEIQVCCNVGLYTEGFDYPGAECIVLARPTKSLGLYLQMAGRGLRTHPGKEEVIIIDHGGCIDRLGFIEEPRIWSLGGKKLAWSTTPRRKAEKTPMTCEMCSTVFAGPRCPHCGYEVQDWGKKIKAIEAELVELKKPKQKEPTMEDKRRWYGMFEYYRRQHGYGRGWSSHKYRAKFGVWPQTVQNRAIIQPPDREVMNWIVSQAIRFRKEQEKMKAVSQTRQDVEAFKEAINA